MSRSGYSDDCENVNLWRGAVERAIRGRRGQAFLREMASSLDAMPDKSLVAEELVTVGGDVCALGSVAITRKIATDGLDPEDYSSIARTFGISSAMAQEIMYQNDEGEYRIDETPQQRWQRMRKWVGQNLGSAETTV